MFTSAQDQINEVGGLGPGGSWMRKTVKRSQCPKSLTEQLLNDKQQQKTFGGGRFIA